MSKMTPLDQRKKHQERLDFIIRSDFAGLDPDDLASLDLVQRQFLRLDNLHFDRASVLKKLFSKTKGAIA